MALTRLVMEMLLIDQASSVMDGFASKVESVNASAGQQFREMTEHFEDGIKTIAFADELYDRVVAPGVDAAASLQEALAGLEVSIDAENAMATLEQARIDAARIQGPTIFSSEEVIGIQTQLSKAGLAESDIFGEGGAAEAAAQLATAERLAAEQAVDAMIIMGSIFELQGEQFAASADALARAGGASSTNPAELAEALAYAGNVQALGVDQDETLAALGVLAGRGATGSSGGTALNAFLRQASKSDEQYNLGLFEDGELKPLVEVAQVLRETMDGHTAQEQQLALQKAFGDEGARFAQALLVTGDKSLETTLAKMDAARGLEERVAIMSGTYSGQQQALGGGAHTLLGTLFAPALDPLTAATEKGNQAIAKLNEAAEEDPRIGNGVTYGAMGLVGAVGAVGMAQMALGAGAGFGGLGDLLQGAGSTAAGVAKGKALEEAAGVTPVFVVNMPAGGPGGGPGPGPGPGPGGMGGLGKAAAVGTAGAVGIGIGTAVNEYIIQDTALENLYQAFQAQQAAVVAFNGSDRQLYRQDRNQQLQALVDKLELNIQIDKDGNGRIWDGDGLARGVSMVVSRARGRRGAS